MSSLFVLFLLSSSLFRYALENKNRKIKKSKKKKKQKTNSLVDIEALKHAPNWGLRHRRDSLSGLSTHSQPMVFGGGFGGMQSPAPTYHSGMLSKVIFIICIEKNFSFSNNIFKFLFWLFYLSTSISKFRFVFLVKLGLVFVQQRKQYTSILIYVAFLLCIFLKFPNGAYF